MGHFFCNFQEDKSRGKVAVFQPNILMLGLSPYDYVLRALSSVHTNDLEQTLLVSWCCCSSIARKNFFLFFFVLFFFLWFFRE